ncbi:uncharacterized protein CBL_14598 [Carabus blaptoides fortunei]
MGSRRMPALIPIAALRAKHHQQHDLQHELEHEQQQQQCSNNNTTAAECTPCGQRCPATYGQNDGDDDVDDVDEEEVRLTHNESGGGGNDDGGGGDGGAVQEALVASDDVLSGGGEESDTEEPQRSRRRPRQPDDAEPIDETASRDRNSCSVDGDDGVSETADVINSAEAHAPECFAVVSDVTSPLDNLLAVAELEFKQHQEEHAGHQHDVVTENHTVHVLDDDDDDGDGDGVESVASNVVATAVSDELSSATPQHLVDEDDEHVEKDYDIGQLNTLAEVSAEEEPVEASGELEKSEHVGSDDQNSNDCDYNDDDENHMAMTDILDRLEQSLQSPMEEDQEPERAEDEVEECTSYVQDEVINENVEEAEEQQETIEHVATVEQDEQTESKIDEIEEETHIRESVYDIQKNEEVIVQEDLDQPTDLSVKNTTVIVDKTIEDVSEDELPTDLSTHSKKQEALEEVEEVQEDDMQPTDLSIRKHTNPSPALRIDTPRPPSQNSETIQSPQPSGIPAVPPSPDIFPAKPNSKSLFLESLLSSASPKLALTPEVTITRNQKEPLDLGKSRKSASPTVSCSEEAKNKFVDGEPASKRVKIEDITLKSLLHMEKQKAETKPIETNRPPEKQIESQNQSIETSRLLELLTSDSEPDPLTQLKQLLVDTEISIPDPLLVPKDRLSLILSSPAREIPRLLAQRPELRLPEALAYPQLLQDPDILVITLAQLQTILQKQTQPIALQESKPKESKPVEKPSPKPVVKPAKPEVTVSTHTSDIDAATTAAFNQMLWLPYLNHLEAAAMACGNNTEFLKALNSVFPPTTASYPTQMAEMPPMFSSGASRFGGISGTGFPPVQSAIDYANPLELAMWQEAMMQANMQQQQRPKMSMDASASLKHAAYRESAERNAMMHNAKKYHSNPQRVHSSARTSPISHTFHQQRIPGPSHSTMPHPFVHAGGGYPLPGVRHNLQIPHYRSSHSTKPDPMKQYQNVSNAYTKYSQYLAQQAKLPSLPVQSKLEPAPTSQKPRVTCKSLQNLLSPKRIEETTAKKPAEPTSKPTNSTQPMDLSGARLPYSKLKVKQNLMDPVVASFGAKLWKHEDVPEVGSTTEEMTSTQLHETQTHLWHPLFGK